MRQNDNVAKNHFSTRHVNSDVELNYLYTNEQCTLWQTICTHVYKIMPLEHLQVVPRKKNCWLLRRYFCAQSIRSLLRTNVKLNNIASSNVRKIIYIACAQLAIGIHNTLNKTTPLTLVSTQYEISKHIKITTMKVVFIIYNMCNLPLYTS